MKVSIDEPHLASGAVNTVGSLLDGCFGTGVCARRWILLTYATRTRIYGLRLSGFHVNASTWSASNGAGAAVQYSIDGSTFTQCGNIPGDFGRSQQLYDVPLSGPVTAKHLRFHHNTYIGFSQIVVTYKP